MLRLDNTRDINVNINVNGEFVIDTNGFHCIDPVDGLKVKWENNYLTVYREHAPNNSGNSINLENSTAGGSIVGVSNGSGNSNINMSNCRAGGNITAVNMGGSRGCINDDGCKAGGNIVAINGGVAISGGDAGTVFALLGNLFNKRKNIEYKWQHPPKLSGLYLSNNCRVNVNIPLARNSELIINNSSKAIINGDNPETIMSISRNFSDGNCVIKGKGCKIKELKIDNFQHGRIRGFSVIENVTFDQNYSMSDIQLEYLSGCTRNK